MLIEVALDDPQVACVGAEEEVGNRADERDQPEQPVESHIPGHSRHLPLRHAEVPPLPDNVRAEGGGGDVAHHRHHVQDHVEPDGTVDAGDDEQPFEHPFHRLDPLPHRLRVGADGEGQSLVGEVRHAAQSPAPGLRSRSVSV